MYNWLQGLPSVRSLKVILNHLCLDSMSFSLHPGPRGTSMTPHVGPTCWGHVKAAQKMIDHQESTKKWPWVQYNDFNLDWFSNMSISWNNIYRYNLVKQNLSRTCFSNVCLWWEAPWIPMKFGRTLLRLDKIYPAWDLKRQVQRVQFWRFL